MTKIREGYKETEIGVIPEDWEVKSLSSISENKGEYGIGAKAVDYQKGKPRYLRITDIDDFGRLIEEHEYKTIAEEDFHSYILQENDLVFARTGNTTGKTYLYNSKDGELVFAGFLIKFSIDSKKASSEFVRQYCFTKRYWDWVNQSSTRSGQPGINSKQYGELILPLPPLPEQQRIAGILSTADNHIEKLDKIIEYYQLLKKGMMKKLLTEGIGHTEFKETEIGRIPKEWEVKPLGEIASICYGKNQKEIEDESGIYKILGTGGVMGKTNSYLWNQPSVLIGRKGTINKPMYIDEPFWTVDTLFYTKINYGYSGKWLYYYLNAIDLAKYNEATGVPSLNSNTLSKIQIAVPTYSQQLEIEYVLSSLDSNINLLNDEKQDFIQLKKSLMEKLLTGKIRVV